MPKKSNRPTAVIVGMEENGLGVARALSVYRIPCIALAQPHWSPFCQTNTCKIVHSTSWTQEGVIGSLKSIGQRLDQRAPLIITKDEPVIWISDSRKELSEFYEINLPDQEIVDLLMNKAKFIEVAAKEGWPIPSSWMANNKDELVSTMKQFIYPCILKPQLRTSIYRQDSMKSAFRIESQEELIKIYDIVAQWEKEVVIQEWIEGRDDRIAFCLSYYDRRGNPLSMFPGRKLRQWPIRCGHTAIAEPAPEAWKTRLLTLTERIWKKVGFKGLGSIEYKMREGSDSPVIMEPTVGRTNLQNELAVINGQNIPAIAYFDLIGMDYIPGSSSEKQVKLINGKAELRAAAAYYQLGELSVAQWMRDRRSEKKYMVFRANDIGPFIASVTLTLGRIIGKAVESLFGSTVKRELRHATHKIWELSRMTQLSTRYRRFRGIS